MARTDPREDTDLSVTILRGGKQGRVQLRNISSTGASGSAPFPPGLNADVQMVLRGNVVECKVVWARGRDFGVAFGSPLPPDALQALLGGGGVA
ncbi:MAG: PilZ domain-containing protein [Sphingobium sp.]|uniref:PilZ domain-containing protein n=1 Tax=Sphingobium sp. TaxID=1912891 RepID=UPI0029A12C25|nr:PilZ domain-containing protein [Sphingobium sp.]MDX3911214.1 PilZ domain-containing protein [Sphingobium sp.]